MLFLKYFRAFSPHSKMLIFWHMRRLPHRPTWPRHQILARISGLCSDLFNYKHYLMAALKSELVYFPPKQFSPRFGDNFFTVTIENFERVKPIDTCAGQHVVYAVTVQRGRHTWVVKRRFREFDQLLQYLKNKYPNAKQPFPLLPPKTYCSVTTDEDFLMNRMKDLQAFLNEMLLTLHLEKALADDKVTEFIDLHNPVARPANYQSI